MLVLVWNMVIKDKWFYFIMDEIERVDMNLLLELVVLDEEVKFEMFGMELCLSRRVFRKYVVVCLLGFFWIDDIFFRVEMVFLIMLELFCLIVVV